MIFNFNLKQSPIYLALKWERLPVFKFSGLVKKISLILFLIFFVLFLYGFLPDNFSLRTNKTFLGLSAILLVLSLLAWVIENFFNLKIKNPTLKINLSQAISEPEKYNLAEFLNFETGKAVYRSLRFAEWHGVGTNHLLYFLLVDNPSINFIFNRALLDIKKTKDILKKEIKENSGKETVFTDDFQSVILEALKTADSKNHQKIGIGDILAGLVKHNQIFKNILVEASIKEGDISNLAWWVEDVESRVSKTKRFWEYESLAKRGTLAKQWTSGYTITLDKYSIDITGMLKGDTPEFVSHQEQIKIIERILSRREVNNALIVGEPGSGRRSIVYGLAQRSLLGKSFPEINYKRMVELDMPKLIAAIENPEELESTLDAIFKEAAGAGNIILLIDEFHNYIGESTKLGVVDMAGIIVPYLRLPNFQIICITNYEGLHKNVEKNTSVLSLFEKIEVPEISADETLMILESLVPVLEKKYKVFISFPALRDIIYLTDRYLSSLTFPEKAIKVLDEVVAYVAVLTKEKIVLPKHVEKIITEKTEVPVGEINKKEKEVLLNLEKLIHQRIINQEEAVSDVSTAMRRARSEVTIRKGPIGCFLFMGPTGVGKTETSKALAEFYFGSEKTMIRLDMSEFQDTKDIPRLIGSINEMGILVNQVRENPFSLILLDEVEKSHSNILNLFLQVLDEGYLTDGFGKKVDFKNTIIIATSNAGYQIILEAIKQASEWSGVKEKLIDYLFKQRTFRPEFLNRFDAIVVFKPLNKTNLLDISELMFAQLKKNLSEKGIDFVASKALKEKIVELGYNPIFGAREMRRVVQDKVENILASALLSGKIYRGSKVEVDPDFKLIINGQKVE